MPETLEMRVELLDGKYTYIWSPDGKRHEALRHGEPWRDLTGDGFVLAMGQKIDELSTENRDLQAKVNSAANTGWKSVFDIRNMPSVGQEVYVYFFRQATQRWEQAAAKYLGDGEFESTIGGYLMLDVSHWMPFHRSP